MTTLLVSLIRTEYRVVIQLSQSHNYRLDFVRYVLDILNEIFIMHICETWKVLYLHEFDVINDALQSALEQRTCCCQRNESFADLKEDNEY